jgi:hypothetical protein
LFVLLWDHAEPERTLSLSVIRARIVPTGIVVSKLSVSGARQVDSPCVERSRVTRSRGPLAMGPGHRQNSTIQRRSDSRSRPARVADACHVLGDRGALEEDSVAIDHCDRARCLTLLTGLWLAQRHARARAVGTISAGAGNA